MPLNKYTGAYDDHRPVGSSIPSATLPRGGDGKTIAEVRANAFGRPAEAPKAAPKPKRAPRARKTAAKKVRIPTVDWDEVSKGIARDVVKDIVLKRAVGKGKR